MGSEIEEVFAVVLDGPDGEMIVGLHHHEDTAERCAAEGERVVRFVRGVSYDEFVDFIDNSDESQDALDHIDRSIDVDDIPTETEDS